ncbi:hypothetical protein N7462_001379 [Penicillium macrosclerotiorum]|uniref:uncharacterized protein n=1 Tax=Penicillium macrosclerotiorum TaxID=303699 RepID=UPI002547332A|nr:uncharacterized protein N7462_001379 [Penicillium macrosclerotiorum]KAJ5691956.1 hypothetical protein N7462_001379 [Penicillium macrosclerotiorum]
MHVSTISKFSLALLTTLFPFTTTADLLTPFGTNASPGALQFQPVLDFDKDGCYHTAAISTDGSVNSGRTDNSIGPCRDKDRLDHSQTYVRERCNHGWCAYLYGYYFEVDVGEFAGGHTHDWEHIIVWTLNGNVFFVSWSAHGDYTTEHQSVVRFADGTHPKIVYHRGGGLSHSFRKATPEDEAIENDYKSWFKAPLVSLEKMDCGFVRKLLNNNWGSAHPDLTKDRFGKTLDVAMPWDARNNEHFDPWN